MISLREGGINESFYSNDRIDGLTHNFYRYPARFNPQFVRQVISEFSAPDDLVLDPFMGGGTTIVEALVAGRRAIGIDINELAYFVTDVKTTPLSPRDVEEISSYVQSIYVDGRDHDSFWGGTDSGPRNLPDGMQRFFNSALCSLYQLRFPRQRRFLRCALLRVGQWALECKKQLPTEQEMYDRLTIETEEMLRGLHELVELAKTAGVYKNKLAVRRTLIKASATEAVIRRLIPEWGRKPNLVLTSPPYPGVHILYHRWQVGGRRETPAPYWIANLRDGQGASYYTMGSRAALGLRNYFCSLSRAFSNLKPILSPHAVVVQLVAFCDADTQLPLYLDALANAGFEEVPKLGSFESGQVRLVPNRKWYTNASKHNDASKEILIMHRPRADNNNKEPFVRC